MAIQALLPAVQQALPYIKQGWAALPAGVKEGIIRGGIGKGTQWLGNRLFGGTPETEEYQQRLQEQMRLIQDQIRRPGATPVGQAIQRTIKQQGKQAQRALAGSAAQRGQTGTSPARASQMQQMGREAGQQAGAMAQLSAAGQQQYNQLLGMQERLAAEERSTLGEIMGFIMKGVADAATKKLVSEALQDAWEAPPETMGSPAATMGTQGGTPQPVQGGYVSPAPAAGELPATPTPIATPEAVRQPGTAYPSAGVAVSNFPSNLIQRAPVPSAQPSLPPGATPTPITTPEAVRQPGVTYPGELIQRAPMTQQQPGYQPPVYENIPQQEEYARQAVELLNQEPAALRQPGAVEQLARPPEEATLQLMVDTIKAPDTPLREYISGMSPYWQQKLIPLLVIDGSPEALAALEYIGYQVPEPVPLERLRGYPTGIAEQPERTPIPVTPRLYSPKIMQQSR